MVGNSARDALLQHKEAQIFPSPPSRLTVGAHTLSIANMHSKSTLAWATCLSLIVACIAGVTELDPAIRVRNAPGASSADTYRSIGRALYDARAENGKKAMEANVTLDRSWEDAVLFS